MARAWKLLCTSGDSVQLVEQSLDTNLLNNAVRLRLSHCSVLPGGVHIQETLNNVVILISTNQSVHRLLLPHPSRMYRSDLVTELHMQSVLTDVGKLSLQDAAHSAVIPGSLSPTTGTAWLSLSGEAHYALAAPAGGIVVLSLPPYGTQGTHRLMSEYLPPQGTQGTHRLMSEYLPPQGTQGTDRLMSESLPPHGTQGTDRLMSESLPPQGSAVGGGAEEELHDAEVFRWMPIAHPWRPESGLTEALSLAVRELEEDCFIFALCQGPHAAMWSFTEQACVLEAHMLDYMPPVKAQRELLVTPPAALLASPQHRSVSLRPTSASPLRGDSSQCCNWSPRNQLTASTHLLPLTTHR
ncbi:nuclear pore complex protein Nup160-like [Perca fluviatilis]|uniref:nuclear pore complex protein Nup160-like n=1 Tax=Perca fluviatilis TaxID=8168 RepID=UPI0019645FCC|nr:nuclear pore complex protein Nup160-like [Perca fluviatilis]